MLEPETCRLPEFSSYWSGYISCLRDRILPCDCLLLSAIEELWVYEDCRSIHLKIGITNQELEFDIESPAVAQGFEAYVGLSLLKTAFVGVVSEWQVCWTCLSCLIYPFVLNSLRLRHGRLAWQVVFCGMLLVFMAVGNFVNTVKTLKKKSRFKAKMKRTKSKAEMD